MKKTLGLLIASTAILASCQTAPNGFQVLVNQAANIPTLAVKADGKTLESNGLTQDVSGNLTLIREVKTFNELDEEFIVSLDWTINEASTAYFVFKSNNYVTNPEADIEDRISIPVYTVNVLRPDFGAENIQATLTLLATLSNEGTSYTATRDFLLTVKAEDVDPSSIPLVPLGTDFTRRNDAELSYVSELLQNAPRSSRNAARVRARGYVTGIMTDWNTAYITSGEYGLALFRPDVGYRDAFAIGDFIEVTGEAATFNGGRQISWMTNVKFVPATEPQPVIRELSASNFASIQIANNSQRFRDASIVKLVNLQFDQITSGTLPITPTNHIALRLKIIDGNNAYNVNVYLNYHVGASKRQAIYDTLIQAPVGGDQFVTYQGVLGWSFGPQLLPLEITDFVLQS
jgi:hypothetical protein